MPDLRIAQAQINTTVGDFAGNLSLISKYLTQAREAGADIVLFPELVVCGYPPEDLLLKPRFLDDNLRAVEKAAAMSDGLIAVVGYAQRDQDKVYNAAALLAGGRIAARYYKVELPNYGVFDEKRYFHPGQGCQLLDLEGVRLILTICEDMWIKHSAPETCAQAHQAQVALNISSSPFHAGKLALRREILAGFARRSGTYVCYTNLVGGQDELIFDGGSLVMDPQGGLVACASLFKEELLITDLNLPAAEPLPDLTPPHNHISLDLPERSGQGRPQPVPPHPAPPKLSLEEEVYQALVLGTRDYVRKNGFNKVVLGLSGGIDSSLTAAVAVDALGRENVAGVTMPSRYNSAETQGDAAALARNLGIELMTVPIQGILDSYLKEMAAVFGSEPLGVAAENLQARIRGNILMGLSNRFGWLVLTTGNKSETAVGYCTLYGDTAGGFAVIKDVPKTLVYSLSLYVNQKAGSQIIPASVIERPPSAELKEDQTDQDSLPPYEVLDPILKDYVENDMVVDEIAAKGNDSEIVKEMVRLVDLNEYKRRQAPPGVKITPKAFGKDRRLPITNHYRPGWENE
ncbi:MAG: NAD+ synthase [Desulfarculaceae bacterium]|jgi:NAD+ synthase (glutamine-hydrolysing)